MSKEFKEKFTKQLEYEAFVAEMKLGFYKSELAKVTNAEKKKQGQIQLDALKQDLQSKKDYLEYVKST